VQCKHRERTKRLLPKEINDEVRKAEGSEIPIEIYVIATTAQKSKAAQQAVVALNGRPANAKKFVVELHFWEDICQHLSGFDPLQAHDIVHGHSTAAELAWSLLRDPNFASLTRLVPAYFEHGSGGPYEEVEKLLNARNFAAAEYALNKLPKGEFLNGLPAKEQYMVLRLRAKLAIELGQFEEGADLFLAAYEKQPDSEQAKSNQVLAFALKQDIAKAFSLATDYLAEGVATPAMICHYVENSSTIEQINQRMALIREHVQTDESLNLALCHKYLAFGEGTAAVEAAERALAISQDSPHAHFACAISAHNRAIKGDWRERRPNLQGAIAHYDTAAAHARARSYFGLLAEIFVNRAAANFLSGKPAAASADFHEAIAVSTKPGPYAARAASFFLAELDFESARGLLGQIDRTTLDGRFVAVVTELRHSTDVAHSKQFLGELRSLSDEIWPRALECRWIYVSEALRLNDVGSARLAITDAFQKSHPFQAFAVLAWIAVHVGDKEQARVCADKALFEMPSDAHPQELRLLAEVFTFLGEYAKALNIIDRVATPGLLDKDTQCLIQCATRLERHDVLLRVCRELREVGQQDEQTRRIEIQLLEHYAPEQALAVADRFIEESPAPAYFVAFRNVLAIRLNRPDLLVLDAHCLPSASDLSPKEAHLVVLPYLALGRFDDVLRFLHAQLRRNFEDEHAHGQFVSHFLSHGDASSLCKRPENVAPDCAVLLESADGVRRWVVLEDDKPVPSRGEMPTGGELAKCLIGLKVGDVVDLPGNSVQSESTNVCEILTKYVRAFQESIEHFRERFPDTSFIQQLQLGAGDKFDPAPLIESVKQRHQAVELAFEFYAQNACPLHTFAARVGLTHLDAVKAMAQRQGAAIKCCQTTPPEFEQAARHGLAENIVVLDISAIVTLALLEAWQHLDPCKTYVVSRATKELVDDWFTEASHKRAGHSGHIAMVDGQVVFQKTTQEQHAARTSEIQMIRQMIETHCQCRSGESLAGFDPDKRKSYARVIGSHTIETISVSKDLGALFWCDDAVVSVIAMAEFQVTSVWTQLALRCFADAGVLSDDDFQLATAKLASWNYAPTLWGPATIIRAGDHAEWDTEQWPLKQCIDLISKSDLTLDRKARTALDTLKLLCRSKCSEFRQPAVIQAILDAVGHWGAVNWISGRLNVELGIDVASATFLRFELGMWLAANSG
jgi:tetratricopeptide (TPR) repeat protein